MPLAYMYAHPPLFVGLHYITAVTRGTVHIQDVTIPVSNGYREQLEQFFSRWKWTAAPMLAVAAKPAFRVRRADFSFAMGKC